MKELLLFFAGLVTGYLYFGHLYLQLEYLKNKYKIPIFFTFAIRFSLLSIVLGILFYLFNSLAIYTVFGFIISRLGIYFISHYEN